MFIELLGLLMRAVLWQTQEETPQQAENSLRTILTGR